MVVVNSRPGEPGATVLLPYGITRRLPGGGGGGSSLLPAAWWTLTVQPAIDNVPVRDTVAKLGATL